MFNYIHGEIYRLLHKTSMHIYFGVLASGYLLLTFIRSGGMNAQSIGSDASNFFPLLAVLAGGYLFAAIYTDDLSAKNLNTLVGFGLSKAKIIFAKFILILLCDIVIFGLTPLFMDLIYAIFGWPASIQILGTVYALALQNFLKIVAFAVLSGILVYGLQRTTFAMVAYLLLLIGIIGNLLHLLFQTNFIHSIAPNLSDYLMDGITNRILMGIIGDGTWIPALIEYIIYVAIVLGLSVLAFHKKEMEF